MRMSALLVLSFALVALVAGARPGNLLAQKPATKDPAKDSAAATGSGNPAERLVRIRVIDNLYDPLRPYRAPEIRERTGSGIWLGSGQVLTDLRLVRYASVIEFWPPGADAAATPTTALLRHRGGDCGLAIVETSADDSPEGDANKTAANRPASGDIFALERAQVGQELRVFGFESPGAGQAGARGLLVRSFDGNGLVVGSDIDRHGMYRTESVRATAPPGASYSGGPAFAGDRMIGVYFHESDGAQSSYVLEAGTIRAFLADVAADGRYDGFPRTGLEFESIAPDAARRYLGLAEQNLKTGLLVRRVDFQSAAWRKVLPGDILLEVNGNAVDFSGQVVDGQRRTPLAEWIQNLPGAPLKLKLLRKGNPVEATLQLESPALRSPGPGRARLSERPEYFLGAGLVFQELEYDLVHAPTPADEKNGPERREDRATGLTRESQALHRYYNFYTDQIGEQVDRDVVMTARLPDPINADADRFLNGIVRSVNGRRIRNLKDFATEWSYTRGDFVVVEFLNRDTPMIVAFDQIADADERIRVRYDVQENGRVR